jgi:hypothetical protein
MAINIIPSDLWALDPKKEVPTAAHLRGIVKEDSFTFDFSGRTLAVWTDNGATAADPSMTSGDVLPLRSYGTSSRIIGIKAFLEQSAGEYPVVLTQMNTFGMSLSWAVNNGPNSWILPMPGLLAAGFDGNNVAPGVSSDVRLVPLYMGLAVASGTVHGAGSTAVLYPWFSDQKNFAQNGTYDRLPVWATTAQTITTSVADPPVNLVDMQQPALPGSGIDNISSTLTKLYDAYKNSGTKYEAWLKNYYINAQSLTLVVVFRIAPTFPQNTRINFTVQYVESQISESNTGRNFMPASNTL